MLSIETQVQQINRPANHQRHKKEHNDSLVKAGDDATAAKSLGFIIEVRERNQNEQRNVGPPKDVVPETYTPQ